MVIVTVREKLRGILKVVYVVISFLTMHSRPYLYDSGDTYEKPFYNVLLKLLYDVAR